MENGFKRRSFCQRWRSTYKRQCKKHWRTCLFFHLLLRTRLFCRSQVPYQAPPLSDGGLFSSTLGVKRQAPPLPCFVLDKKLTISCRYPGLWGGVDIPVFVPGASPPCVWLRGRAGCQGLHNGQIVWGQPPQAVLRTLQAGRIV